MCFSSIVLMVSVCKMNHFYNSLNEKVYVKAILRTIKICVLSEGKPVENLFII